MVQSLTWIMKLDLRINAEFFANICKILLRDHITARMRQGLPKPWSIFGSVSWATHHFQISIIMLMSMLMLIIMLMNESCLRSVLPDG